jgi:uncharacterized protein
MTLHDHDTLVRRLNEALGGSPCDLKQTHISSVILSGDVVYKLKKPVDFGFLDYATPARRKHFCEEEVRINSRFAPDLYLGVVPVTGSVEAPQIEGEGDPIAYAVKMRRFPEAQQLDAVVVRRGLSDAECDAIADSAAELHAGASAVSPQSDFGTPERVLAPMQENFDLLRSMPCDDALSAKISRLQAWTLREHARLEPRLQKRKAGGFVRECHGDLHLHNMALFDGKLLFFDAIEFNPYLNHIDVISDLAFVLMDFEYRGLHRQSRRILNRYLERTGDYGAVPLLPIYKTYRAMVRAKVLALHAAQEIPASERDAIAEDVRRYIALAGKYTEDMRGFLVMMHGFSGAGKSAAALEVVERFGAIRLRSDIERQRLFRNRAQEGGLYTADATNATYGRLETLAAMLLEVGVSVVADATFLQSVRRARFESLARRLNVPLLIIDIVCDDDELLRRVSARAQRHQDVSEADEAVVMQQKRAAEPFTDAERTFVLSLSCFDLLPIEKIASRLGTDAL